MKRSHIFGTIAAFALAVGTVAAQSPTQDPSGQMDRSKNMSRNETVTVTGCLSSGGGASAVGSTTGTTGTTGTATSRSSSSATFMLADAVVSSGPTTGTSGYGGKPTTGAEPPSSQHATGSGTSFALVGHEKDLQKDLNARVEVRGTIESSSSAGGNYGSTTSSTTPSTASQQTLRVSSVKKISSSCQ